MSFSSWLAGSITVVGERATFALAMSLVDAVLFFALNLFGHFVMAESTTNWFAQFRILPGRKSDPVLTQKAIKEAVTDKLIGSPIFYLLFYSVEVWINPNMLSLDVPGWGTIAAGVLACMVIEDTVVYWAHRFEHLPRFYASIHKVHHEFIVTNGWAANVSSGTEKFLTFLPPAVLGPMIVRTHLLTRIIFLGILVCDSWVGHCGYDLPFVPFTSALRHNYHHSHNVGTYGLKFPFWDWLMGTDKSFNLWKAKYMETRRTTRAGHRTASATNPAWVGPANPRNSIVRQVGCEHRASQFSAASTAVSHVADASMDELESGADLDFLQSRNSRCE